MLTDIADMSSFVLSVSTVQQWWQWLVDRWQVEDVVLTDPTGNRVWIVLMIIIVVSITFTPVWKFIRQAGTILHEFGHSFFAVLSGRKLSGIKIHSDSSGVSVSKGKPHGIGMILTTFFGYPFPSLVALGMILMAEAGYAGASLLLYNIIIGFSLLLSRNIVGVISCLTALVATVLVQWYNNPEIVSWTVLALAIFYGIAGVRGTWDLFRVHFSTFDGGVRKKVRQDRREEKKESDAYQLFKLTLLPAPVWIAVFFVINIGSLAASLYLMFS